MSLLPPTMGPTPHSIAVQSLLPHTAATHLPAVHEVAHITGAYAMPRLLLSSSCCCTSTGEALLWRGIDGEHPRVAAKAEGRILARGGDLSEWIQTCIMQETHEGERMKG